MKEMCVIFKVNDDADLSKITLMFKDKNGNNPDAIIYRNLRAVNVDDRFSTVTEFADRCRECGAKYGKLLEQELCEDAISRQGAIVQLSHNKIGDDDCDVIVQKDIEMIKALSPVTPQPKVGKWIDSSNGWMCSECKRDSTKDTKYCPNCGAKM